MKRENKEPVPESGGADPNNQIMTLREVADYLHCHYFTIHRLLGKRAIPAFRLGSDWRFSRSDLQKWIDDRTVVVSEIKPEDEPKRGKALKPPRKLPHKPKPKPSPRRAKNRRV
jgi:excisionase family DNA binding protein